MDKKRFCTVVGQDIPNLKKGALRDFKDRILVDNPWMNNFILNYHKTDRIYTFKNGSQLEFSSFKDEQDAKSGKRDIAFFNEANGITHPIYKQIAMRTTEEIFLDYNPTSEFWVHDHIITDPRAVNFYSNFTHNPFIDENVKAEILGLKDTDLEAWKVYGLGKTGAIAELCIENMEVVPEMPKHLKKRGYGMDFGYRADPSTLVDCGLLNGNEIYLDEKFYLYNMKMDDMDLAFQSMGIPRTRNIFADPADPRVIDYLKDKRWKIVEAIKGADSIKYGLALLNQYKIFVTERSLNAINERKRYRYKLDKKTGKVLNEPIDAFNHFWDAARYWAMMNLKPLRKIRHTYRGMTI